jgi:rfaE bifunctional protein kinase chain/domain
MTPARFHAITARYPALKVAIVGDFCLDRYLEIDPARTETSLETGLPVHNVVNVRAQPGAAGTVLNNVAALGAGEIFPVGFCGEDGEGFELRRALAAHPGVQLDYFLTTPLRRTFTYCKPLVIEPDEPPRELNRLDSKNWTPTPPAVAEELAASTARLLKRVHAVIVMDQVDLAETGVVTKAMLNVLGRETKNSALPIIADSRRGLHGYPPVVFKMNAAELAKLCGLGGTPSLDQVRDATAQLARKNQRTVFVTLAERGLIGAAPDGVVEHVNALPLRGPIDIVGAGDSVTANLTLALAAGATLREALELAALASSIVIHQLGTTGTASVAQMAALLPQLSA